MCSSDLLKQMMTGGEPGGGIPSVRDQITELWGCPIREVMGGTDFYPLVWAECSQNQGMHFVAPEFGWFELVEPQSGSRVPLEEGAVGELVYTHLQREAAPIVRFRHRDIVRVMSTGACACGRHTPSIRCIGRADDMLIVKGVNLFPSAVRAVLSEVPGLGSEFRIVRPKGVYTLPGPLKLKIEITANSSVNAKTLEESLHQRLSVAFSISLVEEGSLISASNHKTGYFEDE